MSALCKRSTGQNGVSVTWQTECFRGQKRGADEGMEVYGCSNVGNDRKSFILRMLNNFDGCHGLLSQFPWYKRNKSLQGAELPVAEKKNPRHFHFSGLTVSSKSIFSSALVTNEASSCQSQSKLQWDELLLSFPFHIAPELQKAERQAYGAVSVSRPAAVFNDSLVRRVQPLFWRCWRSNWSGELIFLH